MKGTVSPVQPFRLRDKVTVDNHPTVGEIVEIKPNSAHYLVRRPLGTGFMSHWLPASKLTLVEAAPAAPAATATFKVGDRVRNTLGQHEDKVRAIVEFTNADHSEFSVRKDEKAGDKSPLWYWFAAHCELVESEGDNLSPSESTADVLSSVEIPAAPVVYDAAAVAAIREEREAAIQLAAEQAERAHQAEQDARRLERERATLEKQLIELQNMVVERQPIAPVRECVEVRTLVQKIGVAEHCVVADREMAAALNEGWLVVNICVVTDTSQFDRYNRIVTLQRIITAPVNGTKSRAEAAAAILTGDYVAQSMQPRRMIESVQPVGTLIVENKRQPGPMETMVREHGPEGTIQQLAQEAVSAALANTRARVETTPAFQPRPLLAVKAGQP